MRNHNEEEKKNLWGNEYKQSVRDSLEINTSLIEVVFESDSFYMLAMCLAWQIVVTLN